MDIVTGVALYKAFIATGTLISGLRAGRSLLDGDEQKLLSEILEALAQERSKVALPPTSTPAQLAKIALIAAFGAAFRHSWADTTGLPDWQRSRLLPTWLAANGKAEKHRSAMIAFALAQAVSVDESQAGLNDVPEFLGGDPCSTPLYRRLWSAFTSIPTKAELETLHALGQPVDTTATNDSLLGNDIDVHAFESRIRAEYATNLFRAGVSGTALAASDTATRRAELLRAAMVKMSEWLDEPLFGGNEAMPRMTLREAYVEPRAHGRGENPDLAAPVLKVLESQLTRLDPAITLVLGDFGLGKSLTARIFASSLARALLSTRSPSSECWMPVYVRCSDCLEPRAFDCREVMKRGLRLILQESGVPVSVLDDALGVDLTQRVCVLLDGLDERAMTESQLKELFRALAEQSSPTIRFIVLSRPGAMHQNISDDRIVRMNWFVMTTFDSAQIGDWIQRWNHTVRSGRDPILARSILDHGLEEPARTPVVLFVVAFTWDEIRGELSLGRAVLYERFFRKIADGKLSESRDKHEPILRSADAVRDALRRRGLVDSDSPQEALLFALSLVAWRSHCFEQQGKEMKRRTLERIFIDDLGVDDSDGTHFELVRDGILLSLQHDESAGSTRILYGHKSFREFLVARFWSHTLRRVCKHGVAGDLTMLSDGYLDVYQDAAKRFLEEMFAAVDSADLLQIANLLSRELTSEAQSPQALTSAKHDTRNNFRWSAGVALSLCADALVNRGVTTTLLSVKESSVFSTLWAGAIAKERSPRVWLHRAHVHDIQMPSYSGYWFCDDAVFYRCGFVNFTIPGGWFQRACFNECVFISAKLCQTNFHGAKFEGVQTVVALELEDCDLTECIATFRGVATFLRCDLRGARLSLLHETGSVHMRTGLYVGSSKCDGLDMSTVQFPEAASGVARPSVEFSRCDLRGALLSDWLLQYAVFRDCTMSTRQRDIRRGSRKRSRR